MKQKASLRINAIAMLFERFIGIQYLAYAVHQSLDYWI